MPQFQRYLGMPILEPIEDSVTWVRLVLSVPTADLDSASLALLSLLPLVHLSVSKMLLWWSPFLFFLPL